jgi:hypothetical protein
MLLNIAKNIRWRRASYLVIACLIVSYFVLGNSEPIYGGSGPGLAYGMIGLGLIAVLMVYGIRKRSYKSSWGTVEGWLHAHIYLGLIALCAALLHSGFHFHDRLALVTLVLLALVALSGVWGAILYTTVPPKLSALEHHLSVAQLADQMNALGRAMARLAAGKSKSFCSIYHRLLAAEKPGPLAGWRCLSQGYLKRRLAQDPAGAFDAYVGSVPAAEQPALTELLASAHQRNDLHDRLIHRQRYINLMEVWLYLHVPLSFALLVALAAHVIAVLYFG